MWYAKLFADCSYLVLEEVAERLDSACELDIIGHFYHIVVSLDNSSAAVTCLIASARLDTVRVDSSLCEEAVCALLSYLIPENVVELGTDNLTLLLGICNALESRKELVLAVYADKVHIKELSEGLLDEVALVLAHESLIYENAGELLAYCAAEKSCCY